MSDTKELNAELQASVNKRFEELLKEIGPNRQQLSTKVSIAYREIHKEISKDKIDAKRKGAILQEIVKIEKMAAQQLPHHLKKTTVVTAPVEAKIAAKKSEPAKKTEEKKVASKPGTSKPAKDVKKKK